MFTMKLLTVFSCLLATSTIVSAVLNETRAVSGFTAVESAGPFIVTIDLTGTEGLRIDANLDDDNVTKAVLTYVEDNTLKIRFDWPYNVDDGRFSNLINIHVTAKSINSIVLSGSGAVFVNNQLAAPSIHVVNSGSGNVTLPVQTDTFSVVISGTGNVVVSGVADSLNAVISGAGGLGGRNLDSNGVSVSVYGSGNVVVNAKAMLSVIMMGSGQVKYRGSPMLNVVNMGTGMVTSIA